MEFALRRRDPLLFYGNAAVPAAVQWMGHVRLRGETVPHLAKYFLMAFGEAMGIRFPAEHPAVRAAAVTRKLRATKTAPAIPLALIGKLEALACDDSAKQGVQLAASIFCLMVFASLRFSDIRDVAQLWATNTAIGGKSLNRKDKGGAIMTWAPPKNGLKSNGKWRLPVLSFWESARPRLEAHELEKPVFQFLFPYFATDWAIDFTIAATNGTAQAALTRLEAICGFNGVGCTLHSPRNWFATCATQLAFKREDRETPGRWSAGSLMPDKYDRGVCVTELRLRGEILSQVNDGWRPQKAFEVPNATSKREGGNRCRNPTWIPHR